MKRTSLIFTLFFCFNIVIYADPQMLSELTISLLNIGSSSGVTIELIPLGIKWDENLNLTSNYGYQSHFISRYQMVGRYDIVGSVNSGTGIVMALGKYKIKVSGTNPEKYFIIDWGTSTLRTESHGSPDFQATYDLYTQEFRRNGYLLNGNTYDVWEFSEYPFSSAGFEPFAPENLTVIKGTGQVYEHPIIQWQPSSSSEDYITGYQVYRCSSNPAVECISYALIGQTTANVTIYEDTRVFFEGQSRQNYKIKAMNVTKESIYSNMVYIDNTHRTSKESHADEKKELVKETSLFQNYPNPFNPETKIDFYIPQKQNVKITIYNSLGSLVSELLNEIKDEGYYSIEFNGENLPSGAYFYRIQSGEFYDTKKFILIK